MRDYKVYVCEKCGKEFKGDVEACLDHEEKDHTGPGSLWDEVKNPVYLEIASYYPDTVEIPMKDGSVVQYSYDRVIEEPEQKESPRKED